MVATAGLAAGHGSTAIVVVVVLMLVMIAAGGLGKPGRTRRRSSRRTGMSHRATMVGLITLGLVAGATVAGGRIAQAVVAVLVAIGHAVAGMLP